MCVGKAASWLSLRVRVQLSRSCERVRSHSMKWLGQRERMSTWVGAAMQPVTCPCCWPGQGCDEARLLTLLWGVPQTCCITDSRRPRIHCHNKGPCDPKRGILLHHPRYNPLSVGGGPVGVSDISRSILGQLCWRCVWCVVCTCLVKHGLRLHEGVNSGFVVFCCANWRIPQV